MAALISSVAVYAGEPSSEPMLRIDPGGHTGSIQRIATDKAGRWLVTASLDKTARVWDMRDGRLVTTLRVPIGSGYEGKLAAVALSPDGQTVAVGGTAILDNSKSNSISNSIYLFNRASGRLLRRLTGLPESVYHLAFSHDGRWLAATMFGNNGVRVFAAASGQLLADDHDYGGASNSVQFSSDGRLVTTSDDGLLRLYRFDGNRLTLLVKRAAPGGKKPYSASFSPDGKRIAVGFGDVMSPAVNVLNANDLSLDYAPDTEEAYVGLPVVAWSQDGATLYATGMAVKDFDGRSQFYIRRWASAGKGTPADWPVAGNNINDLATLPDGRLAFGSSEPSWGVINAEGARLLYHAPEVADFREGYGFLKGIYKPTVTQSADGGIVFDTSNLKSDFTLSANGARVHFGYEALGKSPAVFDILNRTFLATDTPGLIPPLFKLPGLEVTDWFGMGITTPKLNGTALELDQGEKSVSLALLPSGDGFVLGTSFNLKWYDRSGKHFASRNAPGAVLQVNASSDGRWVVAAFGDGTIRWYDTSFFLEQLAFYPHPDKKRWVMWTPSGYYDASPGAEELIGWHVNRYSDDKAAWIFDVIKDSPAMRAGLLPGDLVKEIDGKVVSDIGGLIDIVRKTPPNGKLRIKLLRNAKAKLLDVIPNRDNEASEPQIGVQIGSQRTFHESDFFPASRFRKQFYRPDVLTKVLETRDENEAVRLANQESGHKTQTQSIAQVLPPVVEIVSPNEGASVSTSNITLKYSTRTPDDAPVIGLRARVNGLAVNLPDVRNLAVTATAGVREITLPIPPQDSEIQLFAENKNGISTPATLRVIWAGKKPDVAAEDSRFKPKLYVLAVGVSKYQNPDYNLMLAAKDATDFAAVLKKQKGKLYGDVVVRLLTDDKATRDDVVDGLEWLKREVTSRDVGVMFLAGHGINDNIGNYYFLPHNADPDKLLRTGVAQNDIKLTLNSLAGKAMFFVDTCHSGNALGTAKTRAIGSSTDALVNELASAENGVIVFSSSTGRQLSQEDPAWGNGAFTKAVVEGLSGKAEIGKSGKITHKGLDYYVTERVKALTKGQQSPVSIAPGGITDFPIAVVGK